MRSFLTAATVLGFSSLLVSAAPTRRQASEGGAVVFPLPDGFPNPSPAQLTTIEQAALGELSNAPPPANISQAGLTNLQLIALNEIFEVAYFTELVQNITQNKPGYDQVPNRDFVLKTLNAVVAQEKLHALNANTALKHFNATPIEPCSYAFPVNSFTDAIALAATFTDIVLGTLQDVIQQFAANGDAALTRGIGSVIGQEGEQEGWYRLIEGKVPNALPFLTTSVRDFAFTAIQGFTVPGSCPNINLINLKTFAPLAVVNQPGAATTQVKYTFTAPQGFNTKAPLSIVYLNQQNLPLVEPLQVLSVSGQTITGQALFPYDANEMNGLTIAAVSTSAGPFANADAVVASTIAGPGLIEVN